MPQDYVLIAEPDGRLARSLDMIAAEAKLPAVIARDGAEARNELHKRGLPALLVTNLVLGKLDGFGLLAELRRLAPANQVPAVVHSSVMDLRNTAVALRQKLGISEVAASGMSQSTLRNMIMRALASTNPSRPTQEAAQPAQPPAKPPPSADPARLARIAAMGLVDDLPPDEVLQQLVQETAQNFGVPIALVSLVLEQRQWFKAHYGLAGDLLAQRGTPIEQAFCRHVVDSDRAAPLVVPDATTHPMFAGNSLVRAGKVGSYAGAPLLTSDGTVLGTLCIVDQKPLSISNEQVVHLVALARRVAGELALRSGSRRPSKSAGALPSEPPPDLHTDAANTLLLSAVLDQLDTGIMLLDQQRTITHANPALAAMVGLSKQQLLGMSRQNFIERLAALTSDPEDTLRRLSVHPDGPFLAREEIELVRPAHRVLRWLAKPIRIPGGVAQLATYTDITLEVELRDNTELVHFIEEDD